MGIGAWWHWLVVLLIVVLVFGTKKLRNLGGDVGGAVKDFKDAMNAGKSTGDEPPTASMQVASTATGLIEAKTTEVVAEKPVPKKRAATKKPATKASAPKASAVKAEAKPKTPAAKKTSTKPKVSAAKKSSAE